MQKKGLAIELDVDDCNNTSTTLEPCTGCALGKNHRLSFPTEGRHRASRIGKLIHSDVCGPMSVPSVNGSLYYVLFKDDFSTFRVTYFLKNKSEVPNYFEKFLRKLRGETGNKIKCLRTDNGGEYLGSSFQEWIAKKGITHQTSAHRTPEQNGVTERDNRTVMEIARSMIHGRMLPLALWAEAVSTATYLLNRVSTTTAALTPFEIWYNKKPNLSHLRIFGSDVFVHIPKEERTKLDPKSEKCIFI